MGCSAFFCYTCGKWHQLLFVIHGLQNILLGLPAITALQLLCQIQATYADETLNQFPFTGLGNLGQEYQIQLRQDIQPFALYTARTAPLPLRDKVQEELNRTEKEE